MRKLARTLLASTSAVALAALPPAAMADSILSAAPRVASDGSVYFPLGAGKLKLGTKDANGLVDIAPAQLPAFTGACQTNTGATTITCPGLLAANNPWTGTNTFGSGNRTSVFDTSGRLTQTYSDNSFAQVHTMQNGGITGANQGVFESFGLGSSAATIAVAGYWGVIADDTYAASTNRTDHWVLTAEKNGTIGTVATFGVGGVTFFPAVTLNGGGTTKAPAVASNDTTIDTTANSQNRVSRVANAAALASWTNYAFPVERDDVPGARWADTGASCTNADGYAQVQPATGHCWQVMAGTRFTPRLWRSASDADDGSSFFRAFAYLGALGGSQVLYDDQPSATIAATTQLVIPTNVELNCGKRYEGGDGTPLNTISFTGSSGGFVMADKSSVSGCNLASSTVDHLLEIGGQVGIDHVRVATANSGVLTSTRIVAGQGALDAIGNSTYSSVGNGTGAGGASGSTLTNGTYVGKAFTGGGGTGATVTITIANNVITSGSFDGGGSGYASSFQMGLAAGALYSGSPALPNIATAVILNAGRSHISNLFVSSTGKGVGLAVPPGYDFEDVDHVEVWNGSGGITAGSIGVTFGKIDGLNVTTFKCFGYDTCGLGNGSPTMVPDFQTFTDFHCDLSNYCLKITHPEANLAIVGGYFRSVGFAIQLDNPNLTFSIAGTTQICQGQQCTSIGSALVGAITGNTYGRSSPNSSQYIVVSPATNTGSLNSVAISGNAFDRNGPGVYVGPYAFNVAVGKNAWPYNSSYPYFSGVAANPNVDTVHNNTVTVTPDSNGKFTIATGVNYSSTSAYLRLVNGGTNKVEIVSVDSNGIMTGQIATAGGAAVTSGTFTVWWGA